MKPQLMSLLMGGITLLAVPASAADETINCTATPNCADLGYTKNADSCPDGGIKCPFDENKMFCLRSADLGFQIKNDVKAGDYLYTDGTSSATYTKGKGMVGIVLRPHPGNPRHALVMMLPNMPTHIDTNNGFYDISPIPQYAGKSICSEGIGKGIFGTGKYMAGIGELTDYIDIYYTIRSKLRAINSQYNMPPPGYEYEQHYVINFLSSTAKDSSTYYYMKNNYSLSYGANTISGMFICVMYL